MNILWLPLLNPFPKNDGMSIVISNRMKYTAKKHKIFMITKQYDYQPGKMDKIVENEIKNFCSDFKIVNHKKKSTSYYIKFFLGMSNYVSKQENSEVTHYIEEFLEKQKIDLICIDFPFNAVTLFPIWSKIKNIPIVINQHNIEFDWVRTRSHVKNYPFYYRLYSLMESRRLYQWEQKLYKKENVIGQIFVTHEDKNLFIKNFGSRNDCKYTVSPIGLNLPANFTEVIKFPDDRKNIVFVGAMNYPPNIHGVLWFVKDVFPKIKEKCEDIRLILVGKDPVSEIQNLADDDIIITGFVPSVVPYYNTADIVIIPILWGGGLKTKLIEVSVYGKPVVSTTQGVKGSLFQDKKDLVIADAANDFADVCVDMLKNSEKYSEMAQHMKKTAEENYLWDIIGPEYANILENIYNNFQ